MQPYDVIAEGPFRPKDNLLPVPEGPGLGVTLAPDRLDFLRRHFVARLAGRRRRLYIHPDQ